MSKKLEPCPRCVCDLCVKGISGDVCLSGGVDKCLKDGRYTRFQARRAAPEANEALTLEELRGMDGEPVWLHTFSAVQKKINISQWAILETIGEASAIFLRAGVNTRTTKYFCTYGNRWLAYRRPPEGDEKP